MTDYTNPDWLCIHKVVNHQCKQCFPASSATAEPQGDAPFYKWWTEWLGIQTDDFNPKTAAKAAWQAAEQRATRAALNEIADRLTTYPNQVSPIVIELLRNWQKALAEPATDYERGVLDEHKSHLDFENKLYATLVDPVADGPIKEAEMRKRLLESARWYRQHVHDLESQVTAHHAAPALAAFRALAERWAHEYICELAAYCKVDSHHSKNCRRCALEALIAGAEKGEG